MNKKEEIEYKIKVHEGAVALSMDILVSLRAELAKTEKPKPRHGDFGLDYARRPCLSIYHPGGCKKIVAASDHYTYDNSEDSPYIPEPILGNIFDLLKGWSEPLRYWKRPKHNEFVIQINRATIDFSMPLRYCSFDLDGAEQVWHKLGQIIATKRKENKCS